MNDRERLSFIVASRVSGHLCSHCRITVSQADVDFLTAYAERLRTELQQALADNDQLLADRARVQESVASFAIGLLEAQAR